MNTRVKEFALFLAYLSGQDFVKVLRVFDRNKDKIIASEFADMYDKCKFFTLTSKARMYAIFKAVEYIVKGKIHGDFVECGVWKGGSAMVMAFTLLRMNEADRKIYLYDTFEGMAMPTEEDVEISSGTRAFGIWKRSQAGSYNKWCYASVEEVRENLLRTGYPEKNIILIKGKVEDTIPGTVPSGIALLRLDTDWYESTKHELNHLFPLLAKHGVLILDDYGHWKGAKKACDDYFADKPILLNRIDYTCRIGTKVSQ